MKNGKRPTLQQKKLMRSHGLTPENWLVVKEHTGVPGSSQQNIAEEDRREAEASEAGQRVGGNSVEKE